VGREMGTGTGTNTRTKNELKRKTVNEMMGTNPNEIIEITIDISIYLSTSHLINRKLTLVSRFMTNFIRFFLQIRRVIISIYNMAVYTQGTYRNIVYTMVCCISVNFVTSDDGEGGRQILGLSTAWTVFQRTAKGIEVGMHKASRI